MNEEMYENKATQRNLKTLKEDGHIIMEPDTGMLACGVNGRGKMPGTKEINDVIEGILEERRYYKLTLPHA